MELHQLRYLAAVARTGNFTRAAAECHVSQPSLSQQIRKLEDEVGDRLLDRRRDRAVPTLAGEILLRHAGRALGEVEEATRRLHEMKRRAKGRLRVGAIPTIAPFLLPPVLAALHAGEPGLDLTLHEGVTSVLLAMLAEANLDLVIAAQAPDVDGIEARVLFEEELFAVLPTGHHLARKPRLSIADLGGERFVLLRQEHCLAATVLGACQKGNFDPRVACHGSQIQTVFALVAAGMGISLVPAMACRSGVPPGVELHRIARKPPVRPVTAYTLHGRRSPFAAKLLAMLERPPESPDPGP